MEQLKAAVAEQGEIVKNLKASGAAQDKVKPEVTKLLQFKQQLQDAEEEANPELKAQRLASEAKKGKGGKAGQQANKSGGNVPKAEKPKQSNKAGGEQKEKVPEVKKLQEASHQEKKEQAPKADKAPKAPKEPKAEKGSTKAPKAEKPKEDKAKKASNKGGDVTKQVKHESELGLSATKNGDFASWYTQVVTRSEMIEYYDISGCYILRPWSYAIWEFIQSFFDAEIKKSGVTNTYFPLFVSEEALNKEKDHVEGFAPEVAWVTKSGQSELAVPIAVRPTSETIMYPAFSKWIKSHRDLPLRINQWCNVVRWEFKCPTPFIRSREFLWQEGHSAFADLAEAEQEVLEILELYAQVYEDLLCVPVIKGKKTEKEKFAGGMYTTTVEAFISANGRGIQGATSHCLGQNFARMNDIIFLDKKNEQQHVVQNSWGLTTRTIGVMVMVHGDDKGLVLPPRVAPTQVIIVPIFNKDQDLKARLTDQSNAFKAQINGLGMRADADLRDNYNPGWKFNHWEVKGVPIRLELGPRDLAAQTVVLCRRDTGEKETVTWSDLPTRLPQLLVTFQADLLARAQANADASKVQCTEWTEFIGALNHRKMALAPWCGVTVCETKIKERTQLEAQNVEGTNNPEEGEKLTGAAKSLCVPFDQPALPAGQVCVACAQPAICWCLFGRSY